MFIHIHVYIHTCIYAYTVEDWYNHQISNLLQKDNENKTNTIYYLHQWCIMAFVYQLLYVLTLFLSPKVPKQVQKYSN